MHPGTDSCDMMEWLSRARAACSTTSVSRSSSAITSSPSRRARSGHRTARARARVVRIISPCACREICTYASILQDMLYRSGSSMATSLEMLLSSISEADKPCAGGLGLLLDVRKRSIVVLSTPTTNCCPSHSSPSKRHVCVCSRAARSRAIPLLLLYVAVDYRAQSLPAV
jgi:hypothetical protein